jgi:sugar phosphate isomerase/epimerase
MFQFTAMLNRRKFIKASASAAAASMLASSPLMAALGNRSKITTIGLQLWSVAKLLEKDLTGTLQLIAQNGYKEVELFGPYPFSTQKDKDSWGAITPMLGFSQSGYFGRTVKDLKVILDNNGLRTPAMHVGLDTLRNKLGETAEAANTMGQQYAGIAAIPEEERRTLDDYKRIAEEFNAIGEKAKKLGIRFYYHNHGYGLKELDGKIPFEIILERTDSSLVFFEMDIFWTMAAGADPIKYLDANAGRYKLMHVKDMTKQVHFSGDGGNPKQWIELFPFITDAGSGIIDFKTILSHAKKSGVDHFILENDVMTNPQESLKNGYRYVSSLELQD